MPLAHQVLCNDVVDNVVGEQRAAVGVVAVSDRKHEVNHGFCDADDEPAVSVEKGGILSREGGHVLGHAAEIGDIEEPERHGEEAENDASFGRARGLEEELAAGSHGGSRADGAAHEEADDKVHRKICEVLRVDHDATIALGSREDDRAHLQEEAVLDECAQLAQLVFVSMFRYVKIAKLIVLHEMPYVIQSTMKARGPTFATPYVCSTKPPAAIMPCRRRSAGALAQAHG